MRKERYSKIYIDPKGSFNTYSWYCDNKWNPEQKLPDGKYKKQALRLRASHLNLFKALIILTIKKVIARRNELNENSDRFIPYNITKPIELKAAPYEIRAMLIEGISDSMTLQTMKNHMQRIEDAGIISRRWIRSEGVFSVLINPFILCLIDAETGKIIKTNDFEIDLKPGCYKSKNEIFNNITNVSKETNNNKKKIIQSQIVDKRDAASGISSSLKPEHPKIKTKTVQVNNNGKTDNQSVLKNEPVSTAERYKDKETTRAIKKYANKFYRQLIAAFWSHLSSMYLLEEAPRLTFFYAKQAIQTLMNDNWYFGACIDIQTVEYQYNKLLKALKSTQHLVDSKKRENPRWNMDWVYPNQFLLLEPEKHTMSFKNSMLYIEEFMATKHELDELNEKRMQNERDKQQKTRYNHIISNIIAWIMMNAKENSVEKIYQAMQYLRTIHPELTMKLYTDWKNKYLVDQICKKIKHEGFDYQVIDKCFVPQERIKNEINKLLPKMQSLLYQNKLTISPKMNMHFKIIGYEMKSVPKKINKYTLDLIKSYLR